MRHVHRDLVSERYGIAGPNVNTVEKLAELRRAGVNIGALRLRSALLAAFSPCMQQPCRSPVRMNFSHGEYEYHQSVIDNTRKMVAGMSFFKILIIILVS